MPDNLLSNWSIDVSAHQVRLQPDDINAEALGNQWTFALTSEQAAEIACDDAQRFILHVAGAWRLQLRERHGAEMLFYCWHDAQAGQLRFSAVSTCHGRLPFGCPLEQATELSVVVKDWLESPYFDGIPRTELRPAEGALQETSDFVQSVWVTQLA